MLTTPVGLVVTLSQRLDKGTRYLPLTQDDESRLRAAVGDGDHTFLVIRDTTGAEVVKLRNTCDALIIDRAQDGTAARVFPKGSCARFEMTPAVVKDLICNYDCCDGPCPVRPVVAAGITLPDALTGTKWGGSAFFEGDLPMTIDVKGAPSWVKVEVGANYALLTGTPSGPGTWSIAVAATNASGNVVVQNGLFQISDK